MKSILQKIFSTLSALAVCATAAFFTCSCAERISIPEILAIPEQAEIYTAYNLWYDDPLEMNTLNIQNGSLIPFGTRIEITKADTDSICFITPDDGRDFRIRFERQYRLQGIDDYVRDVFTTKNAEDLGGEYPPLVYEKLRRGIVEKGMTRPMVRLAYGPPCAFRTAGEEAKTWIYWTDYLVGKHVVFAKDKVLQIIQF